MDGEKEKERQIEGPMVLTAIRLGGEDGVIMGLSCVLVRR